MQYERNDDLLFKDESFEETMLVPPTQPGMIDYDVEPFKVLQENKPNFMLFPSCPSVQSLVCTSLSSFHHTFILWT
jgi:hypothetical protein